MTKPKIKPVKAWAKIHDGKIEKMHIDAYCFFTTLKAAQEDWWDDSASFVRVEIRPVERKKK